MGDQRAFLLVFQTIKGPVIGLSGRSGASDWMAAMRANS